MPKPIQAKEQLVDMTFPLKGIDLSGPFGAQATGTTPIGQNVRSFESGTSRARGGQRSGLAKYIAAQVNGAALIQELTYIVGVGYTPPGG